MAVPFVKMFDQIDQAWLDSIVSKVAIYLMLHNVVLRWPAVLIVEVGRENL